MLAPKINIGAERLGKLSSGTFTPTQKAAGAIVRPDPGREYAGSSPTILDGHSISFGQPVPILN